MIIRTFSILALLSLLCACAPFAPGEPGSGVCNEMNTRIIFSGSTTETRKAEIERAEEPLLIQSYDRKCL